MIEKIYKFNYQDINIQIENGIINENWQFLEKDKRHIIITDTNVSSIYKKVLNSVPNGIAILSLKPGEQIKSIATYEKIIKNLISLNVTKKDVIIAFGGGNIQELSSFVACTFLNGLELIQIPTTIISQINSSIIGNAKLTINGLNTLGTNYFSKKTLIDPSFIKSLPKKEIQNGIIEIIKLGLIKDNDILQNIIENKIDNNDSHYIHNIEKCLNINYALSSKKEYQNGEQSILNFGNFYFSKINQLTKNKLSYFETKAISIYFETKENLRDKLLRIYECYFDIIKITNFISIIEKNLNSSNESSNIELVKFGYAKINKNN